ncbi:MAG: replication-associated recombination protein A [Ruminococcaceae bacterium]|nr:replication-associated recombination protein A [Oscillospiraceae bacterium]
MRNEQIADILRPKNFDDIVGQAHLFGARGVLRRMTESGRVPNMIFFGPPGTGKTTAATLIAERSGMYFRKLNATSASLSDVKDVIAETGNVFGAGGVLLYLDEIQYFNRKQQQSLLEYMEDGRITLIASTTENPHFYVYNAIISRSSLFEFKPVAPSDMLPALRRALAYLNETEKAEKTISDELLLYIASCAGGDVRRSLNLLENAFYASDDEITREAVDGFFVKIGNYGDDSHYDLLSCLQKSIRGSDPDAAVFYTAKLLAAGELISVCRRLQVIAAEDIGLAYPQAISIVRSCCESAKELGLPEARLPLADAAILLATAPKSNSAYLALAAATEDIESGLGGEIPRHLQSPLFRGYKYPHDHENHWVDQQYLPNDIKDKKYYRFGLNKTEQAAAQYYEKIHGTKAIHEK